MQGEHRSVLLKSWTRWLVALAGALTVAYVVWIAFTDIQAPLPFAVSEALFLPVGLIAVALAGRVAWFCRASRRDLVAWTLVTASLAAFWIGEVLWVIEASSPAGAQSPAWADLGYLAYYPLLLAALLLLSAPPDSRTQRFRVWLDMTTIFFAGALLVWYFVLRPAIETLAATWGAVITVAYPVGDLLLILGMGVLAVRRSRLRSRTTLVALLAALLAGFAADLAFGRSSNLGTFEDGSVTDAVYLLSWFLFGLAAALERPPAPAGSDATLPRPSLREKVTERPHVLSYFAIIVAAAVFVWALRQAFTRESAVAIVAVLSVLLAMTRQIVSMRETAHLRQERAIAASEQRFQDVLRRTQFSVDHAADPMIWLDPTGRIVEVNQAACRQYGYSSGELVGMNVAQISSPPEQSPGDWAEAWDETRRQGTRLFEAERRTKSGRLIPVEIRVSYVEYGDEELCVSFARDITERRRAEQALREAEAQLRQVQKMDAIGQLAGGIAHDFNNLLTAIVGYSQLILNGNDASEAVREDVEAIKSAADMASALTRQILLFSRRTPLEPQDILVNDIVAGIEQLLRRTLGEHVELITVLDPDAGSVKVEVAQFEQAIVNLAVNARDAMPRGGRVTIETGRAEFDTEFCERHPRMQPGPHVTLIVSDNGTGMDEETRTRAFEPFFTTKQPGKGTGLGLATVYGTVLQSRGGIFIYSEPGCGTSVKIYLPRLTDAAEPPVKQALPLAAAHGSQVRAHSETVLVVEDEEKIRRLVQRVLRSRGYMVLPVATADKAIALLEDDSIRIDMLLTDVILPGPIQGGELAQRALARRPGLPILYMSGYTRDIILQAGRLQDGMHYLEKPFSPDVLERRVREVLDQGSEHVVEATDTGGH